MEITPILIGALLGSIAVWLYLQSQHEKRKEECTKLKKEQRMLRQELAEVEGCGNGLERFIERRNAKRETAKAKIITALKARGSLKNEEIADLAKISSATVVRYPVLH